MLQVKSNCYTWPLQCIHTWIFFFLQQCDGTSLLHDKALSSVGDCLNECSPVAPRLCLRGDRASYQATSALSHGKAKFLCLWHNPWVRLLLGPLAYGGGSTVSTNTLVCGWMPNCCVVGVGGFQAGSLIQPPCWCHSWKGHLWNRMIYKSGITKFVN